MSLLRRSDLTRVVMSIMADEIGRARGRAVALAEWSRWRDDSPMNEDGVGVDSLDRIALATRLNEFFHLHETGAEDYLLLEPDLGGWVRIIEFALGQRATSLSVRSSGSTGACAAHAHAWARLASELDAFDAILGSAQRVVSFAPPHHLFGFLFGAFLPSRRDLPVVDGRLRFASAPRWFEPGDLVVATPFVWRAILKHGGASPSSVTGLASGAPCGPDVWSLAREAGLSRLIEIYGATETAGVGWRESGEAPFALLPIWRPCGDGGLIAIGEEPGPSAAVTPPDHLDFHDDRLFEVLGRRDKVVQIAGVNVSIADVVAHLRAHAFVAEAAVRPASGDADARLKAFVVPSPVAPLDPTELDAALRAHAASHLAPCARPASITFGSALPRNDMGKLQDWKTA